MYDEFRIDIGAYEATAQSTVPYIIPLVIIPVYPE
jgi:hypothetical protein